MTRSGNPIKLADLQRVSAGTARKVVLMQPEGLKGDVCGGVGVWGGHAGPPCSLI